VAVLGQFSLQLKEGLEARDILGYGMPEQTNLEIPFLTTIGEVEGHDPETDEDYLTEGIIPTQLTENAIAINDNTYTTPGRKIEELKELFKKVDYEIVVINQPPTQN
jgi:hypothetical protein